MTAYPTWDGEAAVSPNGKKVVFTRLNPEKGYQIYKMNTDGSVLKRIFAEEGLDPSWAPEPF